MIMQVIVVVLICLLCGSNGFYLPGVAPHNFKEGEEVELKVNKLSSTHTQLPYDYYSLKFCKPKDGVKSYAENLGEFLSGDRIENSAYELAMLEDNPCRILCQVTLSSKDTEAFKKAIQRKYHHNWIIDNLPAASLVDSDEIITTEFVGFPVGYVEGLSTYIYNHVNIIMEFHTVEDNAHRIVGFYVEPLSVRHIISGAGTWDGKGEAPAFSTCTANGIDYDGIKEHQKVANGNLVFSYGVEWRESEIRWASRWDVYLSMNNAVPDKVHWFSIVNSLLIVFFLSFMVAVILLRTLSYDINKYNRIRTDEDRADELEEKGWKMVHADVFRPPTEFPMLFCVLIGTGCQLLLAAFFLIIFAALGFLSPANRGSLMIGALIVFVLLGSVAGYTSARLYKTFKGKQWQMCTVLTALLYPGLCFAVFFVLDVLVASYGSTGAVPILSMFLVLLLWFGVSVPMVFAGAYVAYQQEPLNFPVVTSNIPRQIPVQPFYLNPYLVCFLGGILPFGACFVELFFIMSSIWLDQYYYVFGFLLLVYGILVVTCSEVAVVLIYFQLCSEDYRWWWTSMLSSGTTAFFVFLYSCMYFFRLESNMFVTYFLYFGYMSVICLGFFLMTGTVGFGASYLFNFVIYSSIKVD